MWLYQMLQEQAPSSTALMLYLIELAEKDRHSFNSLAFALKTKRIPLDLACARLHVESYRTRKAKDKELTQPKPLQHRPSIKALSKRELAQEQELKRLIALYDSLETGGVQNENNHHIHPGGGTAGAELGADNP